MGSWQWPVEKVIEADPLSTTREIAKEFSVNHSKVIWHLKQIGKVKCSISGCLMSWQHIKKKSHFEVSSSLILCNSEPFSIRLRCATKSGFYRQPAITDSVVRLRRSSKALPKARLAPKKVMVTVWWSADCLIHYGFLNPSETITSEKYAQQIDEMHPKVYCCSWHWLRKDPVLLHNNSQPHVTPPTLQTFNELGCRSFPHPPCLPDLSSTG